MALLEETGEWVDGIYQLEITDPVIGGADGIDNLQAKQLASRTSFLKALLTKIIDGTASVGKAIKLATARKIALSGVVKGEANFDGSANVTIELEFVDGQITIAKVSGLSDALTGKQASSNLLSALAGLSVTAANKMIYSNANTSFALTDLSTFARTLLDDTTGSAMFTTMGALQSFGASGYCKLPNGFTIQWGNVITNGANISTQWLFPIAFQNACLAILGNTICMVQAPNYCYPISMGASSASIASTYNGSANNFILAIGY